MYLPAPFVNQVYKKVETFGTQTVLPWMVTSEQPDLTTRFALTFVMSITDISESFDRTRYKPSRVSHVVLRLVWTGTEVQSVAALTILDEAFSDGSRSWRVVPHVTRLPVLIDGLVQRYNTLSHG